MGVWHWQLLERLKNISLLGKIISITVVGHLFCLFALFVLYKDNAPYHVTISTMIDANAPILFMPMHKSIKAATVNKYKTGTPTAPVSGIAPLPPAPKKVTTLAAPAPKAKIPTQKKAKAVSSKKQKKENKIVEPVQKKVVPEPPEVLKKIETPQETPLEKAVDTNMLASSEPDAIYVGQQEMEALQLQEFIQREIAQHWMPPPGMPKETSCIIKVTIAFDGNSASADIQQSSGVLIFDGAARKAALKLQPPKWTYGKELLLTFKP